MKDSFDRLDPAPRGERPEFDIRCGDRSPAQIPDLLSPVRGPDEPDEFEEPDDTSDDFLGPAGNDDAKWDVFLPDDDELDPLPDLSDFWLDPS